MIPREIPKIPVTSDAGVTVFQELLLTGSKSRAEVARDTGLSPAAVTKAVSSLIAAGYLAETGAEATSSGPGRPSRPLAVRGQAADIVGVKVTPTRVYGVLTDLTGRVLVAHSAKSSPEVEAVIKSTRTVVGKLRRKVSTDQVAGVGVGLSGDVDPALGIVRRSPRLGWTSVPLGESLSRALDLPVRLVNDVHGLARGEQMFGLGTGLASFAVVTLGSGIGCGVVLGQHVIKGAFGVAGEIGHLPLAPGGLTCVCGRVGCVETVAASDAVAARLAERTGQPNLTFADAVALARAGHPAATEVFAQAGQTLGLAMATLVNLVGPASIVLAGEAVDAFDLCRPAAMEAFRAHAFGAAGEVDIQAIPHSFDDWARGAAAEVIWRIARGT